jgi:nucleoside-diphosphate-sugar epimerase
MASPPRGYLLTGANGFIASHILEQLLASGSPVIATVRSEAKAHQLLDEFEEYPAGQLSVVTVPDMTVPGAFDAALSHPLMSIDTILHTASPFLYKAAKSSNKVDFLDPAIKGTQSLLESAKKAGTVNRIVMTSSCAAVIDYVREATPGITKKIYTDADWNAVTYAEGEVGDKSTAYRASKKLSETLAWDFVKENKGFDLVVLCPPAVFGPMRIMPERIEGLNESNSRFWKLFIDSSKDADIAVKMPLHVYVDVRDLATAHILAATVPEAGNQRFLICAGSFSNRDVTEALRASIPDLEERTPVGKPGSGLSETDYGYDGQRAAEVLGLSYRPMEETWVELGSQLLAIEKEEKEGKEGL